MGNSHRLGDRNFAHGEIISTSVTNVYVNGKLKATDGDPVSPDLFCDRGNVHCAPVTANGSPNVYVNGLPASRGGDLDSCGDMRDLPLLEEDFEADGNLGSLNVFIN